MEKLIVGSWFVAMGFADAQQDPLYSLGDKPWALGAGNVEWGLFHHLQAGVGEDWTVDTTGLTSLVAPDLALKRTLVDNGSTALAVSGGFNVPTYGLRLLQGIPLTQDEYVPFAIVPGLGVSAGWTNGSWSLSGGVVGRKGLRFGDTPADLNPLTPTEMMWLDPMIAPIIEGWTLAGLGTLSWSDEQWRAALEARVVLGGGPDYNLRLRGTRWLGEHHGVGAALILASEQLEGGRGTQLAPRVDWEVRF